ncbi:mechanosensitive ion channel family protein [Sphingomonas sp. AX6]|uniref:mechanosensitive ion channel family protein n=1 Tax=Sphingomonas sp. AX6 TaxID=2653171 RepID=UPI0012EEFEF0|nr:mechanosensitive ion channel domain-containing protein [Sphingomonas sp. AX6]VXC62489.1 Potassium efflux system KefA protein / Small-conductance mechanosensitive channel [Sphingomonas sp. AX6]
MPLEQLNAWLVTRGLVIPPTAELIEAAIALGFALLALAAGWYAGRRFGPRLNAFWTDRVGHAEGLAGRMGAIVRHGTAALLLAILFYLWPWKTLAALGFGISLGAATAMLLLEVMRGLSMPRWAARLIAAFVFVAILSGAIGGLGEITALMESVGFNIGRRRISLLSVVTLLVTIIALFAIARLANRLVAHSIEQARGFDATQKLLFQKLAGVTILVALFFFAIDLLGLDLTTFAVFSGAFGLAIGFGLQKTVGNLFAGIVLLMDRSIKPGDVIVVGDQFGWVNKIGVRAVSVITRDGKEHLIPNENLMTQEVENWSYSDRNVRVRIPVGVAYESDIKLAQQLMLDAANESPRVLNSPKPNVWLTSFGDYALEHEILAWINDPEGGVGNVKSDVLNRLWVKFQEHGIEIPFPQQVLHFRSTKGDQIGSVAGKRSDGPVGGLEDAP